MDSDQLARAAEPLRVLTNPSHAIPPPLEADPTLTASTATSQPDTAAPKLKEATPSVSYYKLFRQDAIQARSRMQL